MSGFSAQFEGFARARKEMLDVEEALRAAKSRASASVAELTDTGWSGQASQDFVAGWQEWTSGADDLLTSLNQLSEAIDQSAADYHARDMAEERHLRAAAAGPQVPGSSGLNME
ncbi:hypothetical protein KEM60_02867 [Austwickia sp. TVS 96-490-7B]|uniref:WXG100 family type VII secretion target n=1 Tax=Austwickia sp. TVS 96-490-7B TaxID=2830843 RepID=UPI001C5624C3|nr:WXG100 family type VII secretion target [Austwickia sp. TVS 96-490-7B]MBW3086638.1 hypothetical protein [Austwickia sp. TVS 96-490-7B]